MSEDVTWMDQNITWIDENDNPLGEVSIAKAHQDGLLHRISAVYLTNEKKHILLQKRADNGKLDHSAAGHVDLGESYLEAAKRELQEELGVANVVLEEVGDCSSIELQSKIRHKFKVYKCLANPGKLSADEIEAVFWAEPVETWNDMKIDVNDTKYTGGFKATLELFLKKSQLL